MEFILEFIFDILLEGSSEVAKDKKRSPWIRIPCLILILAVGIIVIGGLGFAGIYMFIKPTDNTSYIAGMVCLIMDIILIMGVMLEYKKEKKKREK